MAENFNDTELLRKKLEVSEMMHRQIAKLNSESNLKKAINEVLAYIGRYLGAERAYIFEETNNYYSNTFEWCAEGVSAEIDTLQDIPADSLFYWIETLEQGKSVVVGDIEDIKDSDPFVYKTLKRQNIKSAVEAPITIGSKLIGFIGVDNAPKDITSIVEGSLILLGAFIGTVIHNREEHEKIRRSYNTIKDNHDMQKEMLNSINCGVFAYTVPEHKILLINDEAKKIISCKKGDDPIQAIMDFIKIRIVPQDRQRVCMAEQKLKNPGDSIKHSYRVQTDGGIIDVQASVKLLQFVTGQKYILCSMLDTTEQTKLTNSLAMERKSYREALANGSEFSFFFDVTTGLINEEFVTAHGVNLIREFGLSVPVSFDELLAKYMERFEIVFANDEMAKNFTCKGLIEQFHSGITNAVTEYCNPERDLYIRTNCLMSCDEQTNHIHASVVASDITEIRRKENMQKEALKSANNEMNKRLDAILNGISGGLKIADVNNNYRYEYVSEGAAMLQGYTVEEFLDKFSRCITSNIYEDDSGKVLIEAERQMTENGGFYTVKYRVLHKDGSVRWVIDRGKLVWNEITGRKQWYILMQDVTEMEERNTQLSNILAMQEEMADSFSGGFFAYTLPERDILILNQEADRIFHSIEKNDNNLIGSMMTKIDSDDIDGVRKAVLLLKNPGDRVQYVFHADTVDGGRIAVRADTKLLSFGSGKQYILSSVTDITEQELMKKKLDKERRQYRNALMLGSETLFTVNLNKNIIENHVISADGTNLTKNLGLTMPVTYDELAQVWFSDERIISKNKEAVAVAVSHEKLIELCNKGTSIVDFEYYVPATKKYRRILILLYKIEGHINANFVIYDITSDRSEEKKRRDIISSLSRIYSSLYHISLTEKRCTILKAHADIDNYLHEYCDFDYFYNLYTEKMAVPEYKQRMAEFLNPDNIRTALANNEYTTLEFQRQNLGWCRLTLVASERDKNGDVIAVVFAGNVIDGQKKAELAQQEALRTAYEAANIASSAKTDFLANMSHDIRTPMNAIIGLTAIACTHMDDRERLSDCLSKITVSSKHLLGIINEVLDMSKIESGEMDLQEGEFNLAELIDNLLTMSKPEVSAKGHELSVSIKNIDHENVIGDSQRIQQAFMNLMSNAIKYTQNNGKIRLTISEKPTNKLKVGCYEFIFEDNGIGMSEDFQKCIFEPFARARDDTRVDKIQGTGLGMPITRNIIQMMNGDIKVESKLNEGTRITVTFFLKLKNQEEFTDYSKFIDVNVLVADDDRVSCEYTCDMLREIGMNGEWVLTGREAVERVVEHYENGNDFFAVILDWRMPEMDGIETTKEIRKRVGRHVPIIIISAYDWSDIELEARAAGANAFISKPLFKSRMVHLFNELICGETQNQSGSELDAFSNEDFSGKRALLVEDNELNAEIAGEILDMAGLTVDFAKDGKQAVDIMTAVEDGYYDVVFMDIQMPVMNGYEASHAIRALSSNYAKSVPIIAMTANAFAEDVTMAKNAGMNEHIAKPLDFGQLLKALKKWL